MEQSLKNFSRQFEFEPKIINGKKLKFFKKIIVVGMGGSHLAADILKIAKPELDIIIHKNYGLPLGAIISDSIVIVSSYSGNTEEVIDTFNVAFRRGLNLAAISTGGELLELAQKNNISYVELPKNKMNKIQPRLALGYSLMALLKLIGDEKSLKELKMAVKLIEKDCQQRGEKIAKSFRNKIPIIYSSVQNEALAQIWKINFNETSKIPAFYNVFPELNHNEMSGFSGKFNFLILEDVGDDKRIIKRMRIFKKIFSEKGFKIEVLKIKRNSIWLKIFDNVLISAWAAYYLAKYYGNDPRDSSLIEKFKKLLN